MRFDQVQQSKQHPSGKTKGVDNPSPFDIAFPSSPPMVSHATHISSHRIIQKPSASVEPVVSERLKRKRTSRTRSASSNSNYNSFSSSSSVQLSPPPRCKFLYITGLPFKNLSNVRNTLGPKGLGINLRHVLNVSWVTDTVLEAIILEPHVKEVERRIGRPVVGLCTVPGYDPLNVGNFPWPADFHQERKHLLFRQALVSRFARSYAGSNSWQTKRFMSDFMHRRGWKEQFLEEVTRYMIKSSAENTPAQPFAPIQSPLLSPDPLAQDYPPSPNNILSLTKPTSSTGDTRGSPCKDN